jgi:ElaB/YqjD/DUF883 family membrane-anchored ribosome-binding protein
MRPLAQARVPVSGHTKEIAMNTPDSPRPSGIAPGAAPINPTAASTAAPGGTHSSSAPGIAETVRHEVDDARERASGALDRARSEAGKIGETVKSKAREEAERRKSETASHIDDFASSVRRAADDLADKDQSTAARFVQEAASGLESVSRSIRTHSIEDMARSVAQFGRERPTTFLAGAVLAGIAIGRFVKASAERTHYDDAPSTPSRTTGSVRPPQTGNLASPAVIDRSTAVLGDTDANR